MCRREKSLEAYQAQTTCVMRMQHEIKTLRAIVGLAFATVVFDSALGTFHFHLTPFKVVEFGKLMCTKTLVDKYNLASQK